MLMYFVLSLHLLAIPEAVEQHLQTLRRLESYHVTERAYGVEEGGARRLGCVHESWKRGIASRSRSRCPREQREAKPSGDAATGGDAYMFMDESLSATEFRTMTGWDPEHPPQLPLEFGRSPTALQQIGCLRGSRNPDVSATPGLEVRLMREVMLGVSLEQLATEADLEVVEAPGDSVLRIRMTKARSPKMRLVNGMLFDLDRERGCSICRVEFDAFGHWMVYEVTEFTEHDGPVWLPKRIEIRRDGRLITVSEIDFQSVNQPIADADLVTPFPPGARVDDRDTGKILVWGTDGPVAAFESREAYDEYIYRGAREYQSRNFPRTKPVSSQGSHLVAILIVNGVLVAALVGLTFLRRRLARRAAGAAAGAAHGSAAADSQSAANRGS